MPRPTLLLTTIAATLFAVACTDSSGGTAAATPSATMVSIDTADTNQYMLPLGREASQPVRDAYAALEKGDVAAFVSNMSDSIVFILPDGTEIKGKQAVTDYWTNRFATIIKQLKYSNVAAISFDLYRTRANTALGKYTGIWMTVEGTYQTGKSVTFPAHAAVHSDASGKFDRWMSYYDTKGIAAATAP